MQILQWLFKMQQVHDRETILRRKTMLKDTHIGVEAEETSRSKDLSCLTSPRKCNGSESGETLAIFLSQDNSSTCFYSSLTLKHLRSCYGNPNCLYPGKEQVREIKMGHKTETSHVGGKVLPICDGNIAIPHEDGSEKRASNRRRTMSRMKELLRWAAAAKSDKLGNKGWKVLYFRNRRAMEGACDGEMSTDSSKISFTWDVGSCSTSSSVYSPLSLAPSSRSEQASTRPGAGFKVQRPELNIKDKTSLSRGNWITSDSECKPFSMDIKRAKNGS